MKKFAVLITTALAAMSLTAATAVYAEEADATVYPELASTLTFTSLAAYDVSDDGSRFAFAQGEYIYVFDGTAVSGYKYSGTLDSSGDGIYYYAHSAEVTDLEFDGDGIAFTDGDGTYLLSGGTAQKSDYEFTYSTFTQYGTFAYSVSGGNLSVWDGGSGLYTLSDGVYSMLKECGSTLYAIKDNSLCAISAAATSVNSVSAHALEFEYVDLSQGETVLVGDTADILSGVVTGAYSVTLAAGTYVTQVDMSDLGGTYFNTCGNGTFALTENTTYLYICTTGSVDILFDGESAYLTSGGNAKTALQTAGYSSNYAYMNTAANVYSMAYMCDSTRIGALEKESVVQVNFVIENGLLQCGFALVTYTADDGSVVTGYVGSNFLTEYYFAAEDGDYDEAEYADGYSEENVIIAVCLVIVIVILVIAGVAFISYSSGTGKRKKSAPDNDPDAQQ